MAIDQEFIEQYQNLLVVQYWEKPKAKAEIGMKAGAWSKTYDFLNQFSVQFDLDQATADRLDKIGAWVGIGRRVPFIVPKLAFGFQGSTRARGFGDKWLTTEAYPFQDKFEPAYSDLQLNDVDYQFFIKAKIAVNTCHAYMMSEEKNSVQDVVNQAFESKAYVVDNYDMTLKLYVSYTFDIERIKLIEKLGLLPKPQGVRYTMIIQADPGETFGFSENPNSKGFGDKFNPAAIGGVFANKVLQ